ncbi:hypothetical protein ABEB36_001396 [Hypothenemus hampei]|uniref:Activating transcription factor 7-interacting protein Fn3 domain-containing protein n=1 Tax=Hypothenemus hampei TaxID=57062 RepID=A0ABD1FHN5_HYPHA
MPSIEQANGTSGNVTLPTTTEVFNKFKPPSSENGKGSDSEESFHLDLDDFDDTERESVTSNGRNKEIREETEDDILNKFDSPSPTDQIDLKDEDAILKDDDVVIDSHSTQKQGPTTQINMSSPYESYEDGEFKSLYEVEAPEKNNETCETMVTDDGKETSVDDMKSKTDPSEEGETGIPDDRQVGASVKGCSNMSMPNQETDNLPNNEKTEDDESDLLDVSMVLETEEDDACAIRDAIADAEEKQLGEKSDEEPNDRLEIVDKETADKEKEIVEETITNFEDPKLESDDKREKMQKVTGNKDVLEELGEEMEKMDAKEMESDASEEISQDNVAKETPLTMKRPHSSSESDPSDIKKPKIVSDLTDADHNIATAPSTSKSEPTPTLKTLSSFAKFMQCRKLTGKLSRSDLEQFCIQKICECLMLKSTEGELHQEVKKQQKNLENLRKELQQLSKQCSDLEVVNKKLMGDLRSQNGIKKPLVPLKITRSVGLQVHLNPVNDMSIQNRRRQVLLTSPSPVKQSLVQNNSVKNRQRAGVNVASTPVKPLLQTTPQKSPLNGGSTNTQSTILNQMLQKRQGVLKRATPPLVKKPSEPTKPSSNSGVIDLTEDEKPIMGYKTVNGKDSNKSLVTPSKSVGKPVLVGPNKTSSITSGIRLTPASVIPSSGNGSSLLYMVPTITTTAPGGQPKVTLLNFQPTNGVLSGTLNGSPVSVMSNKSSPILTIKTLPPNAVRLKHPAPLPSPPRIPVDPSLKPLPPKPHLTLKKIDMGIILQWKMPYNLELYEAIASYQLYAYQETNATPNTNMWRKVGDVKALALPMACTLTQFADKNKYYFAVRSVDVHKRFGAFSDPEHISL